MTSATSSAIHHALTLPPAWILQGHRGATETPGVTPCAQRAHPTPHAQASAATQHTTWHICGVQARLVGSQPESNTRRKQSMPKQVVSISRTVTAGLPSPQATGAPSPPHPGRTQASLEPSFDPNTFAESPGASDLHHACPYPIATPFPNLLDSPSRRAWGTPYCTYSWAYSFTPNPHSLPT